MAETLQLYQKSVAGPDGARYGARACGSPIPGGKWQGWIEFVPLVGGRAVRTARETTQPNRVDTVYWAIGISAVYLEGALRRALARTIPAPERTAVAGAPARPSALPNDAPTSAAVLDPFAVYEQGEGPLRRRLAVLTAPQLVRIAVAHNMSALDPGVLLCLPAATLLELIVLGVVRERALARRNRRGKRSITRPTPARVFPSNTTRSDQ
jgi:hypothetical protein